MSKQGQSEKKLREKKRKARRDLIALLKRLRKVCGRFESADEWIAFVEERVFPLADEYQQVLPGDHYQRLKNAARLSQPTRAAANQACSALQIEVQQVISLIKIVSLPVAAAQFAAGLIITLAVVAGAAVLALNTLAPTIRVSNIDCGPIPLQVLSALNNIPGIDLPEEIPADGQPHALRLFPGQIDVDSSQPNELSLRLFGLPVIQGWEIGGLTSIVFVDDGSPREIFGQDEHISLGPDSEYEVILACR